MKMKDTSEYIALLKRAEKHLRSAGGWAHYGGDTSAKLKVGDQGVYPGRCVSLMPVDASRCSCGLQELLTEIARINEKEKI